MAKKSGGEGGGLVRFVEQTPEEGSLNGADIARAYKITLSDFVRGSTSRASTQVVGQLLNGALAARRQELAEAEGLTAQRVTQFYK